jgi:branched-chain amino acid transport system ATP-binding protein
VPPSCAFSSLVLIVEQNVKQTLGIADRAYVLENGRVVMEGTGESLLGDEHVKTAYLGV